MLAPPTNLHAPMSSITERSVHLYWTAPAQSSNVKGYRIYYNTCYLTSCDTKQTTTTQTDVTVNSLSPGTEYIFRVAAYNDDTVSPKTIGIVVNTNGNPLPVPSDLNVTGTDFNSVSLSWKINQTGQWLYGIYYGKNSEDLKTSKLTTKNLTYVVNKLESGVEYLFRVGVVGPNGIGLKSPVIFGRTKFDDRLRPRHVLATGINFTVINVSWWSPRDLPEKLGYIIYYREKRGNSSLFQNVTVPPTSKTKLSFNLTNLIPGAEYLIKMSTHEKGALLTEIISGKT
uniref:Titin-like n=1 Tax=Saccoglossus kowalevskii TaxID=10224 RepID=A0ABM0MV24_SACKO